MKIKIILFTIISFYNFSYGQITELKDTIKGNVKSFKETWYEARLKNKGFQKSKYLHDDEYLKNENNIFVKKTIFPLEKYELPQNEFNLKNQIISSINYYEDGKVINKTTYFYKNDLLVEENFYLSSDTIKTKKLYEYKNGKKIKIIEYNYEEENKPEKYSETTYSYDEINNIVSEKIDFSNLNLKWLYQYKYNDKKFLKEVNFAKYKDNEKIILKPIKKIIYISNDGKNWLSAYFIDEFDEKSNTKPSKIYFIERQINYEN